MPAWRRARTTSRPPAVSNVPPPPAIGRTDPSTRSSTRRPDLSRALVLACLPQLLELLGNSEEVNGHSPKLDRVSTVIEGADHLLRALPQLHEAIWQRVNVLVRPDDGVLGQPVALGGSAALIGSLATGPAAVPSTATDGAGFWKL